MSEENYGNFAEPKAPFASRRSEEVVVKAVNKCMDLQNKLDKAYLLLKRLVADLDEAKILLEELEENEV